MISSNDHASSPEISKNDFGKCHPRIRRNRSARRRRRVSSAGRWLVRQGSRPRPEGSQGRETASLNIEVVQGDFNDEASIRSAMTGVYGRVQCSAEFGAGWRAYGVSDEDEIRYGTMIADIAAQVGVSHLVYTSVNAAGPEKTGMGHFDSKSQIEAHIRSLDISSTIIRPAGFMELLMLPGLGLDQDAYVSFCDQRKSGK